jgi:hypothetical protein
VKKSEYFQLLLKKRPNYTKFIEHIKSFAKNSSNMIKTILLNSSMIIPFIMDSFFNMLHQDRIAWSKT